jgi:hypothetical protein
LGEQQFSKPAIIDSLENRLGSPVLTCTKCNQLRNEYNGGDDASQASQGNLMAKKMPAHPAAPKTHPLDWSHKLILPAIAILVAIVFGSFTVYFGLARQAAEKEVERLKIDVKQHAEQEQQAKDETQWLRVEIVKEAHKEKTDVPAMIAKGGNNEVALRVAVAMWLADSMGALEAMKKNDADKFGEQVKELWDKAVKQAEAEGKSLDWKSLDW